MITHSRFCNGYITEMMAKFNIRWQNAKEPFSKSTLCEIVKGEEMRIVCKIPIIDLFWGGGGGYFKYM